jgi:hypothetical protein
LETCLGDDFEIIPYLQQVVFDHDEAVGSALLDRFQGGAALFPPDIMACVASRILSTNEVPEETCRAVVGDFSQDPQGLQAVKADDVLQRMTELLQVRFVGNPPPLIEAQELEDLGMLWEAKAPDFFNSVGFRLARERIDGPDAAADGPAKPEPLLS